MASCRNIRSLPSFILSSFFLLFSFCPSLFNNFDGLVGNKETEGKTEGGAEFALKCLLTKKNERKKRDGNRKDLNMYGTYGKGAKNSVEVDDSFFFFCLGLLLYTEVG